MQENNAERDAEIIRLAEEGEVPRAEIAVRFGITPQRVSQITGGTRGASAVRQKELRKLYKRQAKRASNPPPKGTATGFNQLDLRTCTCGSFGERIKDHEPACSVVPVLDERIGIDADKERRLILGQLAKEEQAQDRAPDEDAEVAAAFKWIYEVADRNKVLEAEVASLRDQVRVLSGAHPAQVVTADHGRYEKA